MIIPQNDCLSPRNDWQSGAEEVGIGRLRKSGGQKIDLISLLLNKFS